MKIKEYIIHQYNEAGGPRDFIITSGAHENYLKPLHKELSKFGVEMTEIILYAISVAAISKSAENNNFGENSDWHSGQEHVFQIPNLDEDKIEFLLSVMIKLYGVNSLSDYKQMIKRLEQLAETGLQQLHETFFEEYFKLPDKFIDLVAEGRL